MNKKTYPWCKHFESTKCPRIGSQAMQRIFTPNSKYKGNFSNVANDWDIFFALDTCNNCDDFKHKNLSVKF